MLGVNDWSVHLTQSSLKQVCKLVFKYGYLTEVLLMNFIKRYSFIMFLNMGVYSESTSLIAIWKSVSLERQLPKFDWHLPGQKPKIHLYCQNIFNNTLCKYVHLFTSGQVFWTLHNTHFYFHPRHLQIFIALCMASLVLVCRCNTSRIKSNLLLFSWTVRKMSIEFFFLFQPPLDVPIHVSEVYNDPEDILFVVYVC